MADLSNWDFAEHFRANEAAALMLGIPPEKNIGGVEMVGEGTAGIQAIAPVLRRMKRAYLGAANSLHAAATWGESAKESLALYPEDPMELHSENMERVRSGDGHDLHRFKAPEDFDEAYFARGEIARWLDTIGMKSVYQFTRGQVHAVLPAVCRWPWGNHHTKILGHLEAAAQRWWVNYDPSDATTAPLNQDVSDWLHRERKVSRTMADAIASMLRPDNLPTGPRK